MDRAIGKLKKTGIITVVFIQFALIWLPIPMQTFAQEAPVEPVPCVASDSVPRPTGASGHTFIWNCDTNLWENDYYTWNPNTNVRTAKFAPETRFDETSNLWQTWEWQYVSSSGKYEYRVTSSWAPAPPPSPETEATISDTGPGSENTMDNSTGSIQDTGPDSTNEIINANGTITTTGPQSSNTISLNPANQNTNVTIGLDAGITNNLQSSAVSGDAAVLQNTSAGSAASGDALAMANILNMVQSVWGTSGIMPNLYTANIQGDYFGDIVIDPGAFSGVLPPSGDLEVNAEINASIENNVDLLASSGDATVSQNTRAGDATTGDATAIANIINLINSSISAGQSFVGVLNVHGNLEGDVLLSEDVLDQLIAANVPSTQMTLGGTDIEADLTDNQSITNNINATATSGNAGVTQNTTAGNATTGSAQTNVTVFNLTGRQIVGSNALLVFVNVSGKWVGFITDAPADATAAALGSGIEQNTSAYSSADYDVTTNSTINNNVNVTAETGDAEVSKNTFGGNATSGDAKAAVNTSNITNSGFSLTGWFGMLFINVFGNWLGSFGTDTAYGNTSYQPPSTSSGAVQSHNVMAAAQAARSSAQEQKPKPKVLIYTASFTSDDSGNPVIATVTDLESPLPPSTQGQPSETFGNAGLSISPTSVGLLILIALTFVVVFYGDRFTSLVRRS